jgi:hypothetical protein
MAAGGASPKARMLPSPAGAGSKWPSFTRMPGGNLAMSWVEQGEDGGKRIRFSQCEGTRWKPARTIAEGPRLMLNWADFPSIEALGAGRYVAQWLERPEGAPGAYGIRIAFSHDDGATWKLAFASTRPQLEGYEGFVSFAAGGKEVYASFLDHSQPVTKLRMARFDFDGGLLGEEVVDDDVCSCCQTTMECLASGPVVAYRDHEAGEIRDISIARFQSGKWTKAKAPRRDGWKINACPVNGPAFAMEFSRLAVAWYSAAQGPGVYAAISPLLPELNFGEPIVLDRENPLGRVDIAGCRKGFAVAWLARKGERAAVRVAYLDPHGRLIARHDVDEVSAARSSGFPRFGREGFTAKLAWTGETGVKVAWLDEGSQ